MAAGYRWVIITSGWCALWCGKCRWERLVMVLKAVCDDLCCLEAYLSVYTCALHHKRQQSMSYILKCTHMFTYLVFYNVVQYILLTALYNVCVKWDLVWDNHFLKIRFNSFHNTCQLTTSAPTSQHLHLHSAPLLTMSALYQLAGSNW